MEEFQKFEQSYFQKYSSDYYDVGGKDNKFVFFSFQFNY